MAYPKQLIKVKFFVFGYSLKLNLYEAIRKKPLEPTLIFSVTPLLLLFLVNKNWEELVRTNFTCNQYQSNSH